MKKTEDLFNAVTAAFLGSGAAMLTIYVGLLIVGAC